jgi:uncharacterized protein YjbJ (UPF0337 family)
MMLETRWNEMKGRVEEAWGAMTDDDLRRLEGRWDQVVAAIRRKTGEAVDAIETRLDELIDELDEPDADATRR